MTVEKMRTALMEVYHGNKWRYRVLGMSDNQVIAVYKSMIREDRFKRHEPKKKNEPGVRKAVQISMFESAPFAT